MISTHNIKLNHTKNLEIEWFLYKISGQFIHRPPFGEYLVIQNNLFFDSPYKHILRCYIYPNLFKRTINQLSHILCPQRNKWQQKIK